MEDEPKYKRFLFSVLSYRTTKPKNGLWCLGQSIYYFEENVTLNAADKQEFKN